MSAFMEAAVVRTQQPEIATEGPLLPGPLTSAWNADDTLLAGTTATDGEREEEPAFSE